MALFALSDLHLALSIDKPMDIFGSSWHNYMERIHYNWHRCITDDDLVIIGGDVSWAMYLDELTEDFSFLNSLPGRKLLLKGNHDYWWDSVTRMRNFVGDKQFDTVKFLHNDAFLYNGFSIAGTRGWNLPVADGFSKQDRKIYERELIRLRLSLEAAKRLEQKGGNGSYFRVAVFHYPPVYTTEGTADEAIISVLKEYNVQKCIYGHLHGPKAQTAFCGMIDGVEFMCTSADYLSFTPYKIDLP